MPVRAGFGVEVFVVEVELVVVHRIISRACVFPPISTGNLRQFTRVS